jgi:ketosteroid isomerase-like protein
MTEANIEILERMLEDFNTGGIEAALPYFAPDIEIYDPDLPERTYRGRERVLIVLSQLVDGVEETEVRHWELIPAGDRVVALTRIYYRGEGGEPEVEVRAAHTMTFRDGKIVYWRVYLDRAEALSDAGLDPALARAAEG